LHYLRHLQTNEKKRLGQPHSLSLVKRLLPIVVFFSNTVTAQPLLPDLDCIRDNGKITLAWLNPYENIKSIVVRRSADSVLNFADIATLRLPQKGKQAYTDKAPLSEVNYYKLRIVFKSGLKWSSNTATAGSFFKATTKDPNTHSKQNETTNTPRNAANEVQKNEPAVHPSASRTGERTLRMVLEGESAVTNDNFPAGAEQPATEKELFLTSGNCINTDSAATCLIVNLPEDFKRQRYALKIFDNKNNDVFELPLITHHYFLLDKRNFQKKGEYRYILLKEGKQEETGAINLVR
jgi:hypothetical protein